MQLSELSESNMRSKHCHWLQAVSKIVIKREREPFETLSFREIFCLQSKVYTPYRYIYYLVADTTGLYADLQLLLISKPKPAKNWHAKS